VISTTQSDFSSSVDLYCAIKKNLSPPADLLRTTGRPGGFRRKHTRLRGYRGNCAPLRPRPASLLRIGKPCFLSPIPYSLFPVFTLPTPCIHHPEQQNACVIPSEAFFSGAEGPAFVFQSTTTRKPALSGDCGSNRSRMGTCICFCICLSSLSPLVPWSLGPLVPAFLLPIPYSLLPAFMKPRPNPPVGRTRK
jgi:hypothetical protein